MVRDGMAVVSFLRISVMALMRHCDLSPRIDSHDIGLPFLRRPHTPRGSYGGGVGRVR